MKEVVPIQNLFLLYLMISTNFLASLLGCRVNNLINENPIIKHLLGFMVLHFFIVLSDNNYNTKDPNQKLLYTLGIYLLFIITTKMNYIVWFIFIIISSILYMLEIYNTNDNVKQNTKDIIKSVQKPLYVLNIVVIALGFLVYIRDKKIEYKNTFGPLEFLSGNFDCKNNVHIK